ncbi:E3 ubiquitin-protein ligase HERC2 [Camelus dromedarius]|uniref:E3 ubiquitin-protein ligase HERC2 n=1 Tax=Camelus dromedarius TaxID=9838 RepID=A0A5N4D6M6_CAMDR|nr:E3 ubiquitin-protein ligase HERC2 [Camelus dromedarius]KAB1266771.1 E3 ubiquitin-protein ligase HERC2 [Camelus dromedarius]
MKASPVLTPLCWGVGGPIMRHGPKDLQYCKTGIQDLASRINELISMNGILFCTMISKTLGIVCDVSELLQRLQQGKRDYFRLGHGSDMHVRKAQVVEGLSGKKLIHVAVRALHCLVVSDAGGNLAKQQALSPILTALQIMYARDAVVRALMPTSMVTPVECPLFSSSAPSSCVSAVASPVNGEEYVLAVDTEDRLDPNPWQEKRGEDVESQNKASGPECQSSDEFISLLVMDNRCTLDLLKLSVCSQAADKGRAVRVPPGYLYLDLSKHLCELWAVLIVKVADTWLELWVTELEDITTDSRVATCPPSPWWWRAAIPMQMTLPPVAQ